MIPAIKVCRLLSLPPKIPVDQAKGSAAGADEYLTKPLQTAGLINVVRTLLDPEKRRP